jgi:argininosuccinate lyase
MADGGYLGAGGRLAGGPAEELVEAAYAHELRAAPRLAYDLSLSDIAHAVALTEGGALPAETARALLTGLLELHQIPVAEFPWQPALGDAFNSREAELVRRIGPEAAGWLSAGRPRREAFRVALRARSRRGAAELASALADGAGALGRQARGLRDSLAADYTYLQAAQPTTAGHLLLAYAYPALRDVERLRTTHRELSRSVAGAGGSAGSRWPLDRARLAELLGCEGLVVHAKDAAWQWDVYAELLATLAIAATHLSQLAQDFEIYASHEFGLIELADQHSRASALMPQKRNPYALAAIRAQAGQAAGDVSAALTVTHTGSARTDHFHLLNGLVPRALEEAGAVARLAAAVLAGLRVNAERMAQVAREGFTNAADVADVLAATSGLDYRTAHKVVGLAVRQLVEAGAGELTAEAVAAAGLELTGEPVEVDPAQLDPAACAQARLQVGSSSREAMDAMLAEVDEQAAADGTWASEALSAAAAAEARLLERAKALAAA